MLLLCNFPSLGLYHCAQSVVHEDVVLPHLDKVRKAQSGCDAWVSTNVWSYSEALLRLLNYTHRKVCSRHICG